MSSASEVPKRRGWWRLGVVVVVIALLLTALRVALPSLAKPYLEEQLSALISGSIGLSELRMSLVQGRIGATGIRVMGEGEAAPWIELADLEIDVSWRDLLSQRVRVERLALVRPSVDLQRLADGGLNLARLATGGDESSAPDAAQPNSWTVGIDEIVLRSGGLRFLDHLVGAERAIALDIERFDVRAAEVVGDVYDAPMHFEIDASLAEAPVQISGDVSLGEKMAVDLTAQGKGIPLTLAEAYLDLGWTALGGSADLDLRYELSGEEVNRISGTASVDGATVRVDGEDEPVLELSLDIELAGVDLLGRRAEVRSIGVRKGKLLVRPGDQPPLPLLAGGAEQPAAEAAAESTGAASEALEPAPWAWSVAAAKIDDVRIDVQREDTAIPFDVRATASAVSSEEGSSFPLQIGVREGAAAIDLDGRAGIAPAVLDAAVHWQEVDVPRWLKLVESTTTQIIKNARSKGALKVEVRGDGALQMSGDIAVADLGVGDEAKEFSVVAERLSLALSQLVAAPGGAGLEATVGEVEVVKPDIVLTLAESGLVLPSSSGGGEPEGSARSKEARGGDGAAAKIAVGEFRLRDGSLALHDRTLTPPAVTKLSSLKIEAGQIDPAGPSAERLEVAFREAGGGRVQTQASLRGGSGKGRIEIESWTMSGLSPYAEKHAGYVIERGGLSLVSDIEMTNGGVDSSNHLTLSQLSVGGGEDDFFQKHIGIPLSLAMELLRDEKGDITLDLPFRSGAVDSQVALLELMAKTLRTVLLSSLKSPLKLLGAATIQGGKIAGFGVSPVAFAPAESTAAAADLAKLGETLQQRSGLRVAVLGRVTQADVDIMTSRDGPPGREEIAALANARAEAVRKSLREEYAIDASRLALTNSVGRVSDGDPRVEIEVGGSGFLR